MNGPKPSPLPRTKRPQHRETGRVSKKMKLSVVIAAWNSPSLLNECLVSLLPQLSAVDSEVIVVSNFPTSDIPNRFASFSFVTFRDIADATVPELRTQGIENASGDVIALLEDHCRVDQAWASQIRKAHELPYAIIGGSVENPGRQTPLNWAIYLYDYGSYMLPDVPHVAAALTGFNVSYKRTVLAEVRDEYRSGFYETFINEELQRRGYKLFLMPSVIVHHNKTYALRNSIVESYHHGRLFAALRTSTAPLTERLYRIATSLFLPLLLPIRVVLRTIRKNRVKELITAVPYLLLLMSAWSYGEFCGYLCREGASAKKWK